MKNSEDSTKKISNDKIPTVYELTALWFLIVSVLSIDIENTKFEIIIFIISILFGVTTIYFAREKLIKMMDELADSKEELRQRENKYRSIFETAVDGIFIISADGKILEANESFAQMHGYTKGEIQKFNLIEIDSHDDSKKLHERLKRVVNGEKLTLEVYHVHKKGHLFPLEVTLSLMSKENEPMIQAIYRDISYKKEVEQKLWEETEKLIRMTQQVPGIIYQFIRRPDKTYSFIFASESVKNIYGFSPEELYKDGSLISKVIHPDDQPEIIKNIKESVTNLSLFQLEYRVILGENKDIRWLRGSSMPQKLDDESILWNGYIEDITEQRNYLAEKLNIEKHYQETQRLESLGILASGIAHDFNNILAVIAGYSHMLKIDAVKSMTRYQQIEKIEDSIKRASDLCKQMLTYASNKDVRKTNFNINNEVKEIVKMLRSAQKKNVTIDYDLRNSIDYIFGDSSQIQQVIMNLIINATESIGDKNGIVKVWLDDTIFQSNQTHIDFLGKTILPGKYICMTVSDDGCGMTEETQKRIFEPFYTTKFLGRGLGMSAILGIIKAHNGYIQIESKINSGSIFRVYMPTSTCNISTNNSNDENIENLINMSGAILVADDEEEFRIVAKDLIEEFGFEVMLAKNGKEAINVFEKNKDQIKLIILDIMMPVMNGLDAYYELRKISNTIPVIICSGNDVESLENLFEIDSRINFIQKPFLPKQFLGKIYRMID